MRYPGKTSNSIPMLWNRRNGSERLWIKVDGKFAETFTDGSGKNMKCSQHTWHSVLLFWHFQLAQIPLLDSNTIRPHPFKLIHSLVLWRNCSPERWGDFIKSRKWRNGTVYRSTLGLGLPLPVNSHTLSMALWAALWTCKENVKQMTRLDPKKKRKEKKSKDWWTPIKVQYGFFVPAINDPETSQPPPL